MAGRANLVNMPAEILEEILDNLFKGSVVFIYGTERTTAVWRGFQGFPLVNTCRQLRQKAEEALASRLTAKMTQGFPQQLRLSPHFESFYLPRIQYVELSLGSICDFKLEQFPGLRTLKIIQKNEDEWFSSYRGWNVSNEVIVATLGGHLDSRLIKESQKAWKEQYADNSIIKWKQILEDDTRAFTIIDSVKVELLTRGTTIATMVCTGDLSTQQSHGVCTTFHAEYLTFRSASFSISTRVKHCRSRHGSRGLHR
jgi:hypothetical protein